MSQIPKIRTTLPRSMILRGYDSFSEIFQKGIVIRGTIINCHLCLRASPEKRGHSPMRVGFAVPKRVVSKAVERNRIRRIFREIFRLHKESLIRSALSKKLFVDLVIVFSGRNTKDIRRLDFDTALREWQALLPKIESRLGIRS